VSMWNFDVASLKAQAALVSDTVTPCAQRSDPHGDLVPSVTTYVPL
jgi:hypothetical protein